MNYEQYWIPTTFDNNLEDNSTWSAEKGLNLAKGSQIYALVDNGGLSLTLAVSPENAENTCLFKHFRIFIHKPNEITTTMHDPIFLNYNEVNF
jgi:hypothetical protein